MSEEPVHPSDPDPVTAAESESPAGPPASDASPETSEATHTPKPPTEAVAESPATGAPHVEAEGATEPEAKGDTRPQRRKPRDPAVLRAFRLGIPVEGHVESVIKGGYEIKVGRCRGFCPHSQIDLHRVDDAESMLGKTLTFKVIQVRRGGDDVVVSRRALLEEERTDEAKAVRAALVEGAVVTGKVVRLTDFGAFLDLGAGVTGLAHLTELSHARVGRPDEILSIGDAVLVKIVKLDEESGRISLSMRQAQDDPWKDAASRFEIGRRYPGTVRRVVDFGAFVELAPGLEALAPAREFPPMPGGWRQGLEPGASGEWTVLAIDSGRRRISIIPAAAEGSLDLSGPIEPGTKIKGRVQKIEPFGVFVWLAPGRVGLLPRAWSGGPGTLDERRFPVGHEIDVDVVDVTDDGKRIRLSVGGAHLRAEPRPAPKSRPERPRERAEEAPKPDPQTPASSFGTNLGEMLRAAMGKRDGQN